MSVSQVQDIVEATSRHRIGSLLEDAHQACSEHHATKTHSSFTEGHLRASADTRKCVACKPVDSGWRKKSRTIVGTSLLNIGRKARAANCTLYTSAAAGLHRRLSKQCVVRGEDEPRDQYPTEQSTRAGVKGSTCIMCSKVSFGKGHFKTTRAGGATGTCLGGDRGQDEGITDKSAAIRLLMTAEGLDLPTYRACRIHSGATVPLEEHGHADDPGIPLAEKVKFLLSGHEDLTHQSDRDAMVAAHEGGGKVMGAHVQRRRFRGCAM